MQIEVIRYRLMFTFDALDSLLTSSLCTGRGLSGLSAWWMHHAV